jgi:hypothetical protein
MLSCAYGEARPEEPNITGCPIRAGECEAENGHRRRPGRTRRTAPNVHDSTVRRGSPQAAVCRQIRMRVIEDASAASLHPFVQDCVEPGSTLHTDGWQGYSGLNKKGYQRDRHSGFGPHGRSGPLQVDQRYLRPSGRRCSAPRSRTPLENRCPPLRFRGSLWRGIPHCAPRLQRRRGRHTRRTHAPGHRRRPLPFSRAAGPGHRLPGASPALLTASPKPSSAKPTTPFIWPKRTAATASWCIAPNCPMPESVL